MGGSCPYQGCLTNAISAGADDSSTIRHAAFKETSRTDTVATKVGCSEDGLVYSPYDASSYAREESVMEAHEGGPESVAKAVEGRQRCSSV